MTALTEKIWGNSIGAMIAYGKTAASAIKALRTDDDGHAQVDVLSLPAGTALLGKVGIDQVTANANEVVVKTSALPSGGSTSALQTTGNNSLSSIDGKLPAKGGETPVSGQKTVTSAGTQVAVGGDVAARGLVVIADPDNGGNIYVGPSTVDSSTGLKLPPGGILPCGNVNLSAIYIDSDVSGEGITYYYTT